MLQKITYPTGGFTVFNFESNLLTGGAPTLFSNHASAIGFHHEKDSSIYNYTFLHWFYRGKYL